MDSPIISRFQLREVQQLLQMPETNQIMVFSFRTHITKDIILVLLLLSIHLLPHNQLLQMGFLEQTVVQGQV